jgi:hypothetical protein
MFRFGWVWGFLPLAFFWTLSSVFDVVDLSRGDPHFSAGSMALDVVMALWMWWQVGATAGE